MREADIQQQILLRLGQRPDVRLWRASVGAVQYQDGHGRVRWAKHGKKGQADLTGLLEIEGRHGVLGVRLEVEVKTARGELTKEQTQHGNMVTRRGGAWIVARSADEAEQLLEQVKVELEARL